ncbi:M16 family metallopeptidase [Flavobacterium agrisoli]|uniref:Insulinase family protein n=1 Tax=Flavobacterium agrisoli TaxID=2793066 RepID=A0A934UKJ8_9FLAO|nr:pitrilysin family protein [Flavobacterium agrisoli]MBK0370604.1 insulinase family protein [Flavobacterium agrisoli]
MKKITLVILALTFTGMIQAQDRLQPKPGPAPKVNIKKPQSFTLNNGLKVLVVENHKLPRVTFNLTIDNPPFVEGSKKGVDELTSAMMGNGTTQTTKEAFNEEIDFLGANINFSSQGAYANALSKYSKRVLELLAEGCLQPQFTTEEFDKEKNKIIESLKADEKSVPAISNRVVDALAYGTQHPYGEFITENTLQNVTLQDVQNNYKTYFSPENAYLIIVGDVTYSKIKPTVEQLFGSWQKNTLPVQNYAKPANVSQLEIDLIDVPNAVQSEIALVNTVNLKMNDADFFPVVIANQILGGDFQSYLNMNLREAHAWTYGANSSIGSSKYASKFIAKSAVRNAVTDSAVVEFLKEIKKIRSEKVDETTLKNVKAGYIGRFVMQVEKPQTVARYALNIETENLPADFYEKYIQTINAVTSDDILRVANKYFLADNMRIIITGKASEISSGLEKLNIPIKYYDKFANPTEKKAATKEVPAGVTAKSVFEKYIQSIGGEKNLSKIKTIAMFGSSTIPQAPSPLSFTSKIDVSGKSMVELNMNGMSIMKQVVNDKEAYVVQQGQRNNFEGAILKEMQNNAKPFEELELAKRNDLKVDRIETINNADAYVISNDKSTYYYNVATGLKVAETKRIKQGDKEVPVTTNFADYKEVNGIKLPFNIIQNVGFELNIKMKEVKINEDVAAADFK